MSEVNDSIEIAASPADVWAVIMDPNRLEDWVTAHRKVYDVPDTPLTEGSEFRQKLRVSGASFKVSWTVVEADEPRLAVWKGDGPAGTSADVRYELAETADGTRFDYTNSFELPGGALGKAAGDIAGKPAEKQARDSLENLKKLLES
jgi:carbon monoxide dehydrogenase subunit G